MNSHSYSNETSLRDLFRLVRRGILVALLVGVVLAVAVFFVSRSADAVFEARASVLASQAGAEMGQFGASLATAPAVDVSAYRTAALSSPVVTRALEQLGVSPVGLFEIQQLRRAVGVRTEEQRFSSILHIDAQASSPEQAADLANALADGLVTWDRERASGALQRIAATLESQLTTTEDRIRSLQETNAPEFEMSALVSLRETLRQQLLIARTLETGAIGLLEVIEPALAPLRPISPNPARNAALAFVLGLFLTYGVLLLRDALDIRIRSSDDLATLTGQPVLAEFPKMPGEQRHLPREAVRYLRTNLLFATADAHPKVILVTSSKSAEGKSSVALSLAEGFARNDHRTLLIDADLRKPVVAKTFGIAPGVPSLPDYLRDSELPLQPAKVPIEGHGPLEIVPTFSEPHSPTELLGKGIRSFLERVRDDYDVVVIDSAPLLPVADSLTIAPHVTGTLFVASMQGADRSSVVSALGLLERMAVRVFGVVATRISQNTVFQNDGYGYGYGYGYGNEDGVAPAPADPPADMRVRSGRAESTD